MIVRRWLAPALSVCFLAGAYARPDFHLASGDETPTSVAKHALACLEKLDARGVGLLLSDREVAQTGLGPTAAAAILKGPYAKATSGYKADGPPEVEKLDVDQVAIERSYRMANGRHYLLTFVVTGNGKEIKLTPFSMQLFVALGNSEQAVGENHFTAWRRMLKKNRPLFESVGWKGIISDTSDEKYRSWSELDQFLASEELKTNKR